MIMITSSTLRCQVVSPHRPNLNLTYSISSNDCEVCEVWILYLPSDCKVALYRLISPSISQYNNQGQVHALLFTISVWVLLRPLLTLTILTLKMQKTGPTAYSPYPRRLESLIICWCNYKGSTFSSVILRPWVLVRTHDLPRGSPVLNQLNHRCAVTYNKIHYIIQSQGL